GSQDTRGAGVDTLINIENVIATRGADVLDGNDDANFIRARAGRDVVDGHDADDVIFGDFFIPGLGEPGDDIISAGKRNDTVKGHEGEDVLAGGNGAAVIDGGNGIDTADYSTAGTAILTVDLTLAGPQFTGNGTDTLTSIENVVGSAQVDMITGSDVAN